MGSLPHSLALQHRLTRLPRAAQHPNMHRYSLPHSWGTLSLQDAQCLQQRQGALILQPTNNPTDLPKPHETILAGPSAPPSSCDVSQYEEFGNMIPLSKQQASHGGSCPPWPCTLCPCYGQPWIPGMHSAVPPLDASTSQLRCSHPRTCCSLNQTVLLDHSLPSFSCGESLC